MNNKNSNSGITLVDVRNEAFETIKALRTGSIDVKQAQAINENRRNKSNCWHT
jgi:hypothetical protein